MKETRLVLIRRASLLALIGNGLLAGLKLLVGFSTGSLAILGDGVDSGADLAIALMSLLVVKVVAKPCDEEHPYGHSRAETIATTVLAFLLFSAGVQLFFNAAKGLILGERTPLPSKLALGVMAISLVGKFALAYSQFFYGRKTGSGMLLANAKNMSGDIWSSAAILVGLAAGRFFRLDFLDQLLALFVSVWIVKTALGIFLAANTELMDGNIDRGPYQEIFAAVATVPEACNPHRTRLRKLGAHLYVDLDIEVDPEMMVKEAHEIAIKVERAIKRCLPEVVDVMVHVEPSGNHEVNEAFGLTPTADCGDPSRS